MNESSDAAGPLVLEALEWWEAELRVARRRYSDVEARIIESTVQALRAVDSLAAQLRAQQETIKEIALAVRNPALTDLACRSAVGVLTTDQTLTEEDIRRGREVAEMIRTRRVAATIAQAHAIDESVRQRYVAEIAEQRDRAESLAAQLARCREALQQIADHDGDRHDWSEDVAIPKPSPQEIAKAFLGPRE